MARNPVAEADTILRLWAKINGGVLIPVDPARLAKELGVDVFEAQLDANVSGAIVKKPNADPTILMNREDHPNRQRFTCAHELGHFILHSDEPAEYEYIDYRDDVSSSGTDEEERFANAFAANLLMPADEVQVRSKLGVSAIEMAYEFRVSQEAIVNRLNTLRLPLA